MHEYNTVLLRGADADPQWAHACLANKDYWVSYPNTPGDTPPGTAIRREFEELIRATEKYVVSNTISGRNWNRGRTPPASSAAPTYAEIAALRRAPGARLPSAGALNCSSTA